MSLAKKKYSFHRKNSENKQNISITPPLYTYENEQNIQLNNQINSNKEISINDLIIQNNIKKEETTTNIPILNINDNNDINDKNKDKENITSNSNIQYLINQNETENFDFINTLLKLKGISIDTKGYKSTKNINILKNLEEENIFVPKSSKNNYIILNNNNQGKNNKSIPSNCSTSPSKINTINCNYQNNQNEEEENFKKLDTYSSNDMMNNQDNINNINNNSNNINNNILKKENNSLKELTTIEIKKINTKDTISSESNTNNTVAKKTIKINTPHNNNNNIITTKEHYINLKYTENFNNKNIEKIFNDNNNNIEQNKKNKNINKNRAIIPNRNNKLEKNNKSFVNKKSIEQRNEQLNISLKNKILKKDSIKRIPHTKKQIYEINHNPTINNKNKSKEKKSTSKKNIISKEKKSHKRVNSKKNDIIGKIPNKNLKNNELVKNNIGLIKTYIDSERNNTNKKEYIKNFNTEIKFESNINDKNNFNNNSISNIVEKKLVFDSRDTIDRKNLSKKEDNNNINIHKNNEYIKEIDLKDLRKIKVFNKIKPNELVYKTIKKENLIFEVPFNSERKTSKIFKMTDNIKMKTKKDISPNRSNNLSQIYSRNQSNKNIYKYNNFNNINSYVKIAKNKHYISPSLKSKNKRYTNNFNKTNDNEDYAKVHDNSHYNFSFNSINIILNNDTVSFSNNNNNKNENKTSKLLNKIEQSSSKENKNNNEDDKDNLNKTIDMNDVEFNDDGIKEVKEKDAKNMNIDNKGNKNKKQNKAKFAEIFLFDNDDDNNNNKEEKNNNI